MGKTVVILGASYVGLTVAHKLLKTTLPFVKDFKVILVNPSTHMYWNTASVRAIIPGQFNDEQMFSEIEPGFKQYPEDSFQFVLGTASTLDTATKSLIISTKKSDIEQTYDILVIATGSRTIEDTIPWKHSALGYEDTRNKLHKTQAQVKAANSIVVVGGGVTGIETAAELGFEYGKSKEISIISSADELYGGIVPPSVVKFTANELKKLNVKVTLKTKVTDNKPTSDGRTELTLSTGEKIITDLYLPTIGVIPNTEFVPKTLLDTNNRVMVDEFLRVKGAPEVWCGGDAANAQPAQLVYAMSGSAALAKNLDLVLKGRDPVVYKTDGAPMMGISLGRSRGTGRFGNMKLPSLVVWFLKARNLGTPNLPKYTSGAAF